jgi:hypothetical protein
MNRTIVVLSLVLALVAPAPACAGTRVLPTSLEASFRNHLLRDALFPGAPLSRTGRVDGVDPDALREYFHRSASAGYLAAGTARLYGIEAYEVSRLAVALEGAERLASAALFVGALGTTFAGWDERSSLYFAGAAAAAGALWGGAVHGDDPRWRVRYRWDVEE